MGTDLNEGGSSVFEHTDVKTTMIKSEYIN